MGNRPVNLRVETSPYPHLRDDEGCVLAADYIHVEKVQFILDAVRAATYPRSLLPANTGSNSGRNRE
jgi:hypothetical protein